MKTHHTFTLKRSEWLLIIRSLDDYQYTLDANVDSKGRDSIKNLRDKVYLKINRKPYETQTVKRQINLPGVN